MKEIHGLMSANLALESINWKLRESNANQVLMIKDSEAKVESLREENRELRIQVTLLESEKKVIRQRLEESEGEEKQQTSRVLGSVYRDRSTRTMSPACREDVYRPCARQSRASREFRHDRGEGRSDDERRAEGRASDNRSRYRTARSFSPRKDVGRG